MAIIYRTDSMYRNTPIIDNNHLGVYDPGSLDITNTSTTTVTLTNRHHLRPDVLANDLYGNAKLWWVFAQFNPDTLIDPIIDFTTGKEIIVPTRFS